MTANFSGRRQLVTAVWPVEAGSITHADLQLPVGTAVQSHWIWTNPDRPITVEEGRYVATGGFDLP